MHFKPTFNHLGEGAYRELFRKTITEWVIDTFNTNEDASEETPANIST